MDVCPVCLRSGHTVLECRGGGRCYIYFYHSRGVRCYIGPHYPSAAAAAVKLYSELCLWIAERVGSTEVLATAVSELAGLEAVIRQERRRLQRRLRPRQR